MPGMVVNIGVDKSEIADVLDMVNQAFDLQVVHEPGCCPPCRAHTAAPPFPPFADCRGEEPHAKAAGYGCRCKVVLKHSD